MDFKMYKNIISEIAKKLDFISISNLLGNMGAGEDGMNLVQKQHPLADLMGKENASLRKFDRRALGQLKAMNNKGW